MSTTNSPKASSNLELTPFKFLHPATSLIPLCMDIHPNPGPSQSFYKLPSIIRNTFNDLKRIQQKLARHEHHLENYLFFIRKRLVPHGLLPKTRPAFDSHNPQFHQSWKQNQQYFGRQQLKLLSQECKIKIEDLRRDEIKLKNKLWSICNDSATYDSLTKKLSNHISNLTCKLKDKLVHKQAILTTERSRHTIMQDLQHRPPQVTHPDPDSNTIAANNTSSKRKRRRKRRKTNRKLDTTTVINLSNVQLTQDKVNLLSRGLTFCPIPTHIDWPEFKADISDFIRWLWLHEYFYENDNNNSSDDSHNPFRVKSTWAPHPGGKLL